MTVDRTPKPCTHKTVHHEHGNLYAYSLDGCRCFPCSLTHSRYRRELRDDKDPRFINGDQAREHVAALRAAGMGALKIAEQAGVGRNSLARLVWGLEGNKPSRRIAIHVHRRIMSVQIPEPLDRALVPTVGVRRRLQALATLGWSAPQVAEHAGYYRDTFGRVSRADRCQASTLAAVKRAYDELWDTQAPTDTKGQRIISVRMKALAAKHGWPPPLAWDDETIDDPNARPDTTGMPQVSRDHPRHQQILALHGQGLSDRKIAAAIGVTGDAVRYWRMRIGLTPNTPGRSMALGDEPDDRYRLWQDGLSDQQIADKTGKHPDLIRKWRRRHGLEAAGRPAA